MKKITIIMPVFNKEKYIRETIESVLNQSMHDFEFIIVDDGSTDKSGMVLDEYAQKDQRIRAVHIPNGGVSNARNRGLDLADGEYITFIDADDSITENYLENLYDCIIKSEADIVISGYKKVWEDSDKTDVNKMKVHGLVNINEILPYFVQWQVENGIFGYCWAKMFRKELCNDIYFDTTIRLAEDFDFYLKLYRRIKTIYFDDKHNYIYLQEAQNSSVAKSDYDIDYITQLKINLRYKEFLESKNAFYGVNKKIVIEKISNYFYFSLFYCDLGQFNCTFSELYRIYNDINIEFAAKRIFARIILLLLKHNRKTETKCVIMIYRKISNLKGLG